MKCLNSRHIRDLREQRGWSALATIDALQAQEGHPVMLRQTLARWESEPLSRFDHNSIVALARLYGVPVGELLAEAPADQQPHEPTT